MELIITSTLHGFASFQRGVFRRRGVPTRGFFVGRAPLILHTDRIYLYLYNYCWILSRYFLKVLLTYSVKLVDSKCT